MAIAVVAIAAGVLSVGQMEPLQHIGSLTAELRAPARLAVAADESVLVTDPLGRHIARFDASGTLVDTWPVPEGPIGVAVHPDGRIFVSLRLKAKVAVYDSSMGFLEYLGEDEPLVSFVGPQTSTSRRTRGGSTSSTRKATGSTLSKRTGAWP